jgi:hypothetical protein
MDNKGNIGKYDGPDEFAHVYVFCNYQAEAETIAKDANAMQITCKGKFVAGSFVVVPSGD